MITLKEFIKETLTEIADGLTEFAASHGDRGFDPAPILGGTTEMKAASGYLRTPIGRVGQGGATIMPVTFDVAVTASEASKGGISGGVRVLSVLSVEGGEKTELVNSTVSRVSFRVPLALPEGMSKEQSGTDTFRPSHGEY